MDFVKSCRQAGIIGLMRSGKFLAEESPTKLMEMHRLDTLEDIFLKLSKKQNLGLRRRSSILSNLTGVPPENVNINVKKYLTLVVINFSFISYNELLFSICIFFVIYLLYVYFILIK